MFNQHTLNEPPNLDLRRAVLRGSLVALFVIAAAFMTARVSGYQAARLLEAILPSVRFLASSIMTATATILALMLTLLSLTNSLGSIELDASFYHRVRLTALMTTAAFVASVVVLMLISLPISEQDGLPRNWHRWTYYGTLIASATLGGMLIAVISMLYQTINNVICLLHPEVDTSQWVNSRRSDED